MPASKASSVMKGARVTTRAGAAAAASVTSDAAKKKVPGTISA
jgi:hypothetical protein